MEFTEQDTYSMLQELLVNAIPRFEFPRFNAADYCLTPYIYKIEDKDTGKLKEETIEGFFNSVLTAEEINILSICMVIEWLGQQLATTENIRLKYSGPDFKFTSQANHMAKLKVMIDSYKQDCHHMQRLYKRRRVVGGRVQSTFGDIMSTPDYGYRI